MVGIRAGRLACATARDRQRRRALRSEPPAVAAPPDSAPASACRFGVTDGTALRLSASRFFQPPQPENVLLSSSTEARELSPFAEDGGGADLEPERQWAFEAGVDQQSGALLRFDGAFWYRSISEVADPNVFAGHHHHFPERRASRRATGADMRLEVRAPRRVVWIWQPLESDACGSAARSPAVSSSKTRSRSSVPARSSFRITTSR